VVRLTERCLELGLRTLRNVFEFLRKKHPHLIRLKHRGRRTLLHIAVAGGAHESILDCLVDWGALPPCACHVRTQGWFSLLEA
jgi:hypothetical protein